MIHETTSSSSDTEPCIDIRNNGCLSSWISHIIQQKQQHQQQDRISSSSLFHKHSPTTTTTGIESLRNDNDASRSTTSSHSTVIVEQDNAKRPMNPISEAYMDDIPALVPFYNTDHRNYTKRRMLCYNQKAKNTEKKVKVVSVEKKRPIRRKTIPSNIKNSPSTTTSSVSCSSLVLDRWENQCSSSLKSMSTNNNSCLYSSMPSLPVRLTLESAMRNNNAATSSSSTTPSRNHRKLVLSLTSSCSPSTNDMAPKKPLRKPLLLPRIPCLDEDNDIDNVDDRNSHDQQRAGRHRASTIELLDEALNLIAFTNQIIDNAEAADDDDRMVEDDDEEKV